MRAWTTIGFLLITGFSFSQTVTLNPQITPALFHYNDAITVTYDVTGTPLASLTAAWIWVWMPGISGSSGNATSNINPDNSNSTITNVAKFVKSTPGGKTIFTITFTPSSFFSTNISTQTQIGMLLKGNDWSNGQTSDFVTNFLIGNNFQVQLTSPSQQPLFVSGGNTVQVQATASAPSKFLLVVNNQRIDSASAASTYSHSLAVSDSVKGYQAFLAITSGTNMDTLFFGYLISQTSPSQPRPQGIIDGINYSSVDPSKATLCFWAPNKTSVYVFGDFTNWNVVPDYLMNRDGEHFWIEVTGLLPGVEYAFQYMVNEALKIADPYSDKILDPADAGIPASTYPNLKTFPAKAKNSQDYFNRLSVLQTAQMPYSWKVNNFQKPMKQNLVIYELLIRDFFDVNNRNYQNLIDTISYFKGLGVNAIELMPITEFNGNDSWGYNPTFMFAPDKYYGTKDKLKEFIDLCHGNGIAVIVDMVLNHQDIPNSYAMLDFDFSVGKPTATNKWFNVNAPHPYSVFNDLNHESSYTRKYVDTINYYWLHEFQVDGFRYDLSKGFTQFNSGTNVDLWGQFDASRVNNLERMADKIWSHTPAAYVILEHFAVNSEEKVLAEYRSGENLGTMLWENYNSQYNQATMGYADNPSSDFSGIYFANNQWAVPHGVGYMESHDEERLMYKNLTYGNSAGSYMVKDPITALNRMIAASVLFYTVPGPKMLWEFGELGYDKTINLCADGATIDPNNCRVADKPVEWSYQQDPNRKSIYDHVADLIRLRNNFEVFTAGTATLQVGVTSLVKQITLQNNPYTTSPVDSSQMNVQIAANLDVVNQMTTIQFPHAGTWYDYYNKGVAVAVPASGYSVNMTPGTYKLYTDVPIALPDIVTEVSQTDPTAFFVFPNPSHGIIHIEGSGNIIGVKLGTLTGSWTPANRIDESTWDVRDLPTGLYIVEIQTDDKVIMRKLIRN